MSLGPLSQRMARGQVPKGTVSLFQGTDGGVGVDGVGESKGARSALNCGCLGCTRV